ncbi:hypothetical protein Taro_049041 [Colocasia esculenta]|uniref:JmjC domain-containing protein n=1 Tax=Colocasia esculenta TaxID=4460 RepID=A0A843X9S8_COLES|nr:hypothetical protein [Colocasia esculenta]
MEAGRESSPAAAGAAVEDALLLRHFEGFPSPEYFSSAIEPGNVPAVFVGAVKDWKAFASWDPRRGGLDYLLEQVGSSTVEAMLSRSAPIFYGDLRSHERVPVRLSTFIATCKLNPIMGNKVDSTGIQEVSAISTADGASDDMIGIGQGSDMGPTSTSQASTTPTASEESEQLYLAQVPILNIENKEGSTLESLSEDIKMPIFLESKPLVSVNFWMNNKSSRSSTHYDPHHNLLCVVAGCKKGKQKRQQTTCLCSARIHLRLGKNYAPALKLPSPRSVVLWPPSASRFLYPMPVYGEASNHSSVDIQNSDLSLHPRAKYSMDYSQKAILHAGDALFIPEGWFHQVDSDDLTIGVNLWWQSNIMANMLQHMDAYYLRWIFNRLVGKEMVCPLTMTVFT